MINCCVASPYADSFLSMAEADRLMLMRDPRWSTRTDNEKENAMRIAAYDLGRLRFVGQPLYRTQGLAFPRTSDVLVAQANLTDLTAVSTAPQNVTAESAIDDGMGTISLHFAEALIPGEATRACTLSVSVDGVPNMYYDTDGTGVFGPCTVDYANGDVTFPGSAVDPSTITASWVQATQSTTRTLTHTDLVYNTAAYLPDHLAGGSVHVVVGGSRVYGNIVAHNIAEGTVTLDVDIPVEFDSAVLHPPVKQEIKEAQLVQMCKVLRVPTGADPLAGTGLVSIKIGDTERKYATDQYGMQTLKAIANRNNVAEQVLVLIGYMTVYGKITLVTQEAEDTAYGR